MKNRPESDATPMEVALHDLLKKRGRLIDDTRVPNGWLPKGDYGERLAADAHWIAVGRARLEVIE